MKRRENGSKGWTDGWKEEDLLTACHAEWHLWPPLSCISISTVRRNVVFGRTLFRFALGLQHTAVLVIELSSFRITWPVHVHRLLIMKVRMLS